MSDAREGVHLALRAEGAPAGAAAPLRAPGGVHEVVLRHGPALGRHERGERVVRVSGAAVSVVCGSTVIGTDFSSNMISG